MIASVIVLKISEHVVWSIKHVKETSSHVFESSGHVILVWVSLQTGGHYIYSVRDNLINSNLRKTQ